MYEVGNCTWLWKWDTRIGREKQKLECGYVKKSNGVELVKQMIRVGLVKQSTRIGSLKQKLELDSLGRV